MVTYNISEFKPFIYTIFIYIYSFIHLENSFIQSNLQNFIFILTSSNFNVNYCFI